MKKLVLVALGAMFIVGGAMAADMKKDDMMSKDMPMVKEMKDDMKMHKDEMKGDMKKDMSDKKDDMMMKKDDMMMKKDEMKKEMKKPEGIM
ncbi:hypothetical protein [Campylobacter sp. RM16191]|uniref:hypothetical protein n=1 Tax=Campylobacter sp. RM16191 TaxID=1705728 RepID=UPI001472B4D7|nr:hypothetical protein [Campylobacter sp. RM16191]